MSAATDQELAVLQVLEGHKPTHSEYEGGWWELACTGCDFARGRRLSHMDRTPHAAHRAEVFHEALKAAGFSIPRDITSIVDMDALPVGSIVLDLAGHGWTKQPHGWVSFDGSDPEAPLTVLWQGMEGPRVTLLHEAPA